MRKKLQEIGWDGTRRQEPDKHEMMRMMPMLSKEKLWTWETQEYYTEKS
jgi:hypothetical protein